MQNKNACSGIRVDGFRYRLAMILGLFLFALSSDCAATISKKQVESLRKQIRQALFISDPLPELKSEVHGNFSPMPGIVAERITYGTEYGMRIPAVVYRPAVMRGKLPAILVVNGHGGDKSSWYSYYTGILYAQAGAFVLTYDPVGEGERNDEHKSGTGEHDTVIEVGGVAQRMGGLMVTDAMQGVTYLRSRTEVDPHRIAVLGFSMGSFVTAITGAVDDRIHAILLTGGGDLDGPDGYWDSSKMVMCQSEPYRSLSFLGDRPAAIYTLNARRGTTFILNGTADTVVDIPHHEADFFDALRARVIAMNGTSKNVFETYFVEKASHRPAWLMKVAALWLEKNLSFANWTSAQIQAMPEILIRDWADKNGIPLNKSALREDREGGMSVIDIGVPKLTREQTDVLSEQEWQLHRGEFVYATWTENAIHAAKQVNSSH